MTENELRHLEVLLKKYRYSFSWDIDHKRKDVYRKSADKMINVVRMVIANGGSYHDPLFLVKE